MTTDPSASVTDLKTLDIKVAPVRWVSLAMFVVYGATILRALVPL